MRLETPTDEQQTLMVLFNFGIDVLAGHAKESKLARRNMGVSQGLFPPLQGWLAIEIAVSAAVLTSFAGFLAIEFLQIIGVSGLDIVSKALLLSGSLILMVVFSLASILFIVVGTACMVGNTPLRIAVLVA